MGLAPIVRCGWESCNVSLKSSVCWYRFRVPEAGSGVCWCRFQKQVVEGSGEFGECQCIFQRQGSEVSCALQLWWRTTKAVLRPPFGHGAVHVWMIRPKDRMAPSNSKSATFRPLFPDGSTCSGIYAIAAQSLPFL